MASPPSERCRCHRRLRRGVRGGELGGREVFGRAKRPWRSTFLRLPHGIPSHDTFGRIFAWIDPDQFERRFRAWTTALSGVIVGVVAVDGKTLRRSFDKADRRAAIHMISAWAADNRVVFGQLAVDGKTNEITAIPKLLQMLDLKGLTVTIDAIGCQTAIARRIVAPGGDEMLQVKANQPELHADVMTVFERALTRGWGKRAHDVDRRIEKGHGRIETRRTWITRDVPWLIKSTSAWAGLRAIVCVERERTIDEVTTTTRHDYITSMDTFRASEAARVCRAHWGVENSLHGTLDVSQREHSCRIRDGHAAEDFSRRRRIALNLLRNEPTIKAGINAKGKAADRDHDYLLKVLGNRSCDCPGEQPRSGFTDVNPRYNPALMTRTIVQKFGGTSVADPQRIMACARRAAAEHEEGHRVVVVVSAMGHTTDELIELAEAISDSPSKREMDMLMSTGEQVSSALMAIALQSLGVEAVSMTGSQIGIRTDDAHRNARILSIDADKLAEHLEAGRVVVAAGFQGVSTNGQITTLGRGGSDTTAVAIAAALQGDRGQALSNDVVCEIFTDVDGVYTADPRKVASARKLPRISYEEMLELASLGAGVMHNRAVVFGQKYNVPIHVRHSARLDSGTMIIKETAEMEENSVVGCALKSDLGRVSIRGLPGSAGVQATIFSQIARANVLVDDIIQTETVGGPAAAHAGTGTATNISFTVDHKDLADVKPAVQRAIEQIGRGEMQIEVGLAKVSAVGMGMRTHTGIAATMFKALGDAGIPINNITTSEIVVSCIVAKEHGEKALQIVHDAFGLGRESISLRG